MQPASGVVVSVAVNDANLVAAAAQMFGDLVSTMARLKGAFATPRFAVALAEQDFVAAFVMMTMPLELFMRRRVRRRGRRRGRCPG